MRGSVRKGRYLRHLAWAPAMLVAVVGAVGGCAKTESADNQTFVQPAQVEQWIVNHECDQSGAQKGFPSYGGEGMAQIALVTFVCDNGKAFDIRLQKDGTYKYAKKS